MTPKKGKHMTNMYVKRYVALLVGRQIESEQTIRYSLIPFQKFQKYPVLSGME